MGEGVGGGGGAGGDVVREEPLEPVERPLEVPPPRKPPDDRFVEAVVGGMMLGVFDSRADGGVVLSPKDSIKGGAFF